MAVASPDPEPENPSGAERWRLAAAHFQRWRDGESRSMDELVRLMTPVLWHVVRGYGLDAATAEDVVQSTWLTLVRRHTTIAEPQAVAGWLLTAARREAWRAGELRRRADPRESFDLEPHLPSEESAEESAVETDSSGRLWEAVAQLNERCQRLLRVIAFEERPDYAGLANELQMPVGSIGPTRQRCLVKLRTLLGGTTGGLL